ncbi:MAG: SoxY-related AACIE arm protein [Chitinophagaceae bacterium]|nr:SoxY-related AACIE arm protein [Rubrivivax sp.]
MTARRSVLVAGLGSVLLRPAWATPETMQAALRTFTGGAPLRDGAGRVLLDIAPLVDNGNAVPVTVTVTSPMTAADHVRRIGIFNEHNPQPEVVVFHLGPHSGRALVGTRIRLATTQQVLAVAQMSDGTFWQHGVDVIVTLAACIEG